MFWAMVPMVHPIFSSTIFPKTNHIKYSHLILTRCNIKLWIVRAWLCMYRWGSSCAMLIKAKGSFSNNGFDGSLWKKSSHLWLEIMHTNNVLLVYSFRKSHFKTQGFLNEHTLLSSCKRSNMSHQTKENER